MIKKISLIFLLILLSLVSCEDKFLNIVEEEINLKIGDTVNIKYNTNINGNKIWKSSKEIVDINSDGKITALEEGTTVVTLIIDNYSDSIIVNINEEEKPIKYYKVIFIIDDNNKKIMEVKEGDLTEVIADPKKDGYIFKYWSLSEDGLAYDFTIPITSDITLYPIYEKIEVEEDPYINIDVEEFYLNYTEATSATDAMYRTLHGLMSGSISEQDQEPTISLNRPEEDGKFIRNTDSYYSDDLDTYYIVDSSGEVKDVVYRGGAYTTLEEVAAYIFAFGETPANYIDEKSADPKRSIWGKYLRLNNSYFSGDVDKYPYEPVLPNIRGYGGELYYYEVDLGTTGTDCDPKYPSKIYNDGNIITRGAARIVYTRYDENHDKIIDINEKYLFYTYNHYNDFQEYLNYYGGWGEIFGNITGGGTISSKYDYNPTPYVEVARKSFKALFS